MRQEMEDNFITSIVMEVNFIIYVSEIFKE